jgi:hypothetical protein
MLLQIDASKHAWFGDGRYYDLITILDDATSEIYYAQLVEEEGTRTMMPAVREVIEQQGLFCALYSDRASHSFVTPKAGGKVDENQVTQLGRALKELGRRRETTNRSSSPLKNTNLDLANFLLVACCYQERSLPAIYQERPL